ncbi:MAG TPA: pyrroline-5-carboxylate reductase, partial [Elusimicrobiota bacterium]|nr:pyrroline-5-carboxylate reductase [Elusimicrobiota bacterium]
MNLKKIRLALIGGGNMGAALAAGLVTSKKMRPAQIRVVDVRPEILRSLKKRYGVSVGSDNAAAVRGSDVVLLCVKPQQMASVLAGLLGAVTPKQLVISIAAGIKTDFIESELGQHVPVIRVMPNTPALLRAGALVYCLGQHATKTHEALAKQILSSVGSVWKTGELSMDAVTALSGSGPAYVFYLAECLAKAGAELGLEPGFAEALARQTVFGAGRMLHEDKETPARLRERVTSPGGTTEAALRVMAESGFEGILKRALAQARRRPGG